MRLFEPEAFHLDVKIIPDDDETKLPVESYSIEQNDVPAIDCMIMLPLSFFFIIVELSPSAYVPSTSELNQSLPNLSK